MSIVYQRPEVFTNEYMKYCGGCGHGIINRLIGEIIEEQNWKDKTVIVWPIGCSVYADKYFKVDSICALHGRAPAMGTGIKRSCPEDLVIVYQGAICPPVIPYIALFTNTTVNFSPLMPECIISDIPSETISPSP